METNKNNKGLLAVALVGLLALAGYALYLKSKLNPDNQSSGNNGAGNNNNNGGDENNNGGDENNNGGTPPGSLNYNEMADLLFDAFDGYGTKNTQVLDQFKKLKTNDDFDKLFTAYGVRTINCGTLNPFCTDFVGDLRGAIRDEMPNSKIAEINQVLTQKGITRSI